ncbi:hypothetical protein NSB04_00855 [Blautia pseudococcoides]|nr:hypothetical protein [Blautia pseudococcoides]
MGKQNEYRFNLSFDETDENHRQVCDFLNNCGRKKARYIVKAVMAYWALREGNIQIPMQMKVQETPVREAEHKFVDVDSNYEVNKDEASLMKKNLEMLDNWDERG